MTEFSGVSSSQIKKQIRGIDSDVQQISEEEGWQTDIDTGEEYFHPSADYFLTDLAARRKELVTELARRITP